MKLRNILFIFAAITLGFASCSSESDILDEMNTPVEGLDKETVAVSFNLGNDLQTKAEGLQDASYDEATINNCVIAIFDHATGTMLAKREFILNSGLTRSGNTYTTSNIETKAIPSDVIVVANCPVGYFDNVVTKEGFNKVVIENMEGLTESTLTDSHLIKVWESTEEHPYGINLKDPNQRNISVNVSQIAARIDMNLRVLKIGDDKSQYEVSFELQNIKTKNINTKTNVLTSSNDNQFENKTEESLVVVNNEYALIHSLYTYENSAKETNAVTLTIEGDIVVEGNGKTERIPTKLRTITVNGSEKYIERGYLYEILGTINYEVSEKKVTFGLKYNVVNWYSGNTNITFN